MSNANAYKNATKILMSVFYLASTIFVFVVLFPFALPLTLFWICLVISLSLMIKIPLILLCVHSNRYNQRCTTNATRSRVVNEPLPLYEPPVTPIQMNAAEIQRELPSIPLQVITQDQINSEQNYVNRLANKKPPSYKSLLLHTSSSNDLERQNEQQNEIYVDEESIENISSGTEDTSEISPNEFSQA